VEKINIIPGAKSKATGFRPKNERPSSTIAHNPCAYFPRVCSLDRKTLFAIEDAVYLQEIFAIVALIAEDCSQ